jgi:hypothetical protein
VSEHTEQCLVIEWAKWMARQDQRLDLLFAIPNGAKLPYRRTPRGARYSPEAMRLIAEGLRRGVPDLFLPVPAIDNGQVAYCGLFIEMKDTGGRLTPDQKDTIERLRAMRYRVEVCYGADQAIRTIAQYLGLPYQPDLGLPARSASRSVS